MKDEIVLASGFSPELLEILKLMNNPAYKKWVKRGFPRGNAGILIYGINDKFRIERYNQIG